MKNFKKTFICESLDGERYEERSWVFSASEKVDLVAEAREFFHDREIKEAYEVAGAFVRCPAACVELKDGRVFLIGEKE